MDIDCYERGCACASSSRVAGENNEVVEVVKLRELSDEEIKAIANNLTCTPDKNWNVLFAKAIIKKASEK